MIEVLQITGDLTIEKAQELQQVLLTALDKAKELSVTFADVTAVDLSFLQLLCAAHRTAVRANKIMKLDRPRPEVLRDAVNQVGFLRQQGCILDNQGSCLWKEGWE